MKQTELIELAEIVEKEKNMCQNDCCKNHLTIISGYLLKMMIDAEE